MELTGVRFDVEWPCFDRNILPNLAVDSKEYEPISDYEDRRKRDRSRFVQRSSRLSDRDLLNGLLLHQRAHRRGFFLL